MGVVTSETDSPQVKTKKYKYDPHLDPELQWAGKAERLSFEVPIVPLHIHEKIDPRSIIETVKYYGAGSIIRYLKNNSYYKSISIKKYQKLLILSFLSRDFLLCYFVCR